MSEWWAVSCALCVWRVAWCIVCVVRGGVGACAVEYIECPVSRSDGGSQSLRCWQLVIWRAQCMSSVVCQQVLAQCMVPMWLCSDSTVSPSLTVIHPLALAGAASHSTPVATNAHLAPGRRPAWSVPCCPACCGTVMVPLWTRPDARKSRVSCALQL